MGWEAHGTYIGPDAGLRGKTAILQRGVGGTYLVQFDDLNARRDGKLLGFGWHSFRIYDFKVEHVFSRR